MTFQQMRIWNFLSIGEATVPLSGQGLVLIEGENLDDVSAESNGSGKSAIFDALVWCLYGISIRGLDSDKVVKSGEDWCQVGVEFEDDDGAQWAVLRKRPAELAVTKDKVDLTRTKISETQTVVEEALGMDVTTFVSTVLFGQGRLPPFSSLTDKEQKGVLERLIGADLFATAAGKARQAAAETARVLWTAEASQTAASNAVRQAGEVVRDQEQAGRTWERDHRSRLERARAAWEASGRAQGASQVPGDVRSLRAAQEAAQATWDTAEAGRMAAAVAVASLSPKRGMRGDAAEAAEVALDEARKLTDRCGRCGQPITSAQAAKQIAETAKALKEARRLVEDIDVEVKEANEALDACTRKATRAKVDLKVAQRKLQEAELAERDRKANDVVRRTLKEKLDEIEAESPPSGKLLVKAKARLKEAEEEEAGYARKVDEAKRRKEHIDFLVEAFGNQGIKSFLLDSVVPFLNEKANYYAAALSGGNLSVEFRTQVTLKSGETREKFEVLAKNQHGADVYAGNSAGERRKIDVAVSLALQALSASRAKGQINLALFDEMFDALDSTAGEYAMDLLNEIGKEKDTILVISHREELKTQFPRVWSVVKQDGKSEVHT